MAQGDKGKKDTPKKNGVDDADDKPAAKGESGRDARPSGETSGGKKQSAKAEKADKTEKVEKADKSEAKAAKKEPAKADKAHGHGEGHAHGAAGHGEHAPNRKEYWKIFVVLFVLTALEVAIAQIPGIGRGALYVGLIGLALAKAGCVALFYMHLKHETKVLKYTVAIPFAAPALYAVVLIAEAAYRLTRAW